MSTVDPAWEERTEKILQRAWNDHRSVLYEHEIYEILDTLDIRVPVHLVIRELSDITNKAIRLFSSDRIVLKIISRDVPHKSKVGGVRVVHKDADFIRFSCTSMIDHFRERGIGAEGVLLVEYIDYSQDLGNEILLGFKESGAFGPVISFSKGGSDAVHFAEHFSPPNLILPPIDREWAVALQQSTKIYSKYIENDRVNYINHIVDTEIKFSQLATRFSGFFPSRSKFTFTEFEVNPFVFTPDQDFIALDGLASFAENNPSIARETAPVDSLDRLFKPDGIAVIGVSDTDNAKSGNIILKNLRKLGHTNAYGVNNKGGAIRLEGDEIRLFKTVGDIGHNIDLAVVCVPARATLPIVNECARNGVGAIILIPGGFSEVTGDRSIEEEILAVAKKHHMRIIGPNCLGIVYSGAENRRGINTFFISEDKFRINMDNEQNVAIISQSGAVGITEIYNLRNAISPKVIVSYGNQIDVDPADLVRYLDADDSIDVIGLYIEGFKPGAGRFFFNAVNESKKPIVVYKAGRTVEGRKATESHTASIAGEYEVARAAVKQAGGIVAESIIDHSDFIKTFALLNDFRVGGDRIGIIANAGYEKTYAADHLGTLHIAALSETTRSRLREILPPYVSVDPLLDLTPLVTDDQYRRSIEIMLSAPEVDALCISIVPQAEIIHTTDREIDDCNNNIAAQIVALVHRYKKPVVISVNVIPGTDTVYNKFCTLLDRGGVPTFLTSGSAMACLNAFIRHRRIKEKQLLSERLK
ncbi:MAG: acetate--CoA ligase family protein [Chitinispirillaceae bacterium]|nr:acetate--CoA ligase family protein [Chitinispirillaceae bacterium]